MAATAVIHCTVLEVRPARQGRLLALATVQIDIDGIVLTIEGVQVHLFRFPDESAGNGRHQVTPISSGGRIVARGDPYA